MLVEPPPHPRGCQDQRRQRYRGRPQDPPAPAHGPGPAPRAGLGTRTGPRPGGRGAGGRMTGGRGIRGRGTGGRGTGGRGTGDVALPGHAACVAACGVAGGGVPKVSHVRTPTKRSGRSGIRQALRGRLTCTVAQYNNPARDPVRLPPTTP
ncbi:hypothetical protein FNV68_29975 [Streptomyces sp. S1D4-23]|nr:hypothetical protein FNV61_28830 [Streptomyces sp. RLB3-6]QDO09893.1 hypothetical protein FNV68_29975 [Streptomyces sp. S1D4-23]